MNKHRFCTTFPLRKERWEILKESILYVLRDEFWYFYLANRVEKEVFVEERRKMDFRSGGTMLAINKAESRRLLVTFVWELEGILFYFMFQIIQVHRYKYQTCISKLIRFKEFFQKNWETIWQCAKNYLLNI